MHASEFVDHNPPRCGFCSAVVNGDDTAIALESEAFVAHPDSIVGWVQGDTEVFVCAEGTGCLQAK